MLTTKTINNQNTVTNAVLGLDDNSTTGGGGGEIVSLLSSRGTTLTGNLVLWSYSRLFLNAISKRKSCKQKQTKTSEGNNIKNKVHQLELGQK